MSNCQGRLVPKMHVPKVFSKRRKEWFMNNKYQPLCDYLSKPETMSYLYKDNRFPTMISNILTPETNGLRIYLASYSDEQQPNVPQGYGNQITFIFSPTVQIGGNSYADRGDFYLLNPDSDYVDITAKKTEWTDNYNKNQLQKVLNKLFPFPDGDTRSMRYEKSDIDTLKEEFICQGATGVRIYLASYTDDDDMIESPYTVGKQYLKRLIVQFALTKGASYVDFEIEDMPGFPNRPKPPIDLFDNGQLCPPTNCP